MASPWTAEKAAAFKSNFYSFLDDCVIMSKESGPIRLGHKLYLGQHMLFDSIFNGLQRDIHDYKALKARQLGFSTGARALGLFWLGVHDGLQGACVLDTDSNKEYARREIETMVRNLPARLKFPRIKSYNRYGLTLENDSKLLFMSAGIKRGKGSGQLGRSTGLNFCICSEMCSWENNEGLVSFKQALSETFENRLYLWESTARGFNQWESIWSEAVNDDRNQETIFCGWWSKEAQRIDRSDPAYSHYMQIPPDDEEKERIHAVRTLYGINITLEQLAWYRRKMDPSRSREPGDPVDSYSLSEQPWTASEAFLASGSTFFDVKKISRDLTESAKLTYKSFKYFPGTDITSSDIRPANYIRDTHLRVWDEPDPFGVYVVGADSAFGHDETNDRSACEVYRCYADKLEQVAEFAWASVPTHQFAWLIACLCGWYNNVSLILEINNSGEAVWQEFRNLPKLLQGYLRTAATEKGIRDILTNVRSYVYHRADTWGAASSVHFKTTKQSKPPLMERMRDFHMNGTLLVKSADLLSEMQAVTRNGDDIRAEGRKKDDRVIATALVVKAWEERVRPTLIAQGRTMAVDQSRKQLTPRGRYEIFTKNQLEDFLKKKSGARLASQQQDRYKSWRYR